MNILILSCFASFIVNVYSKDQQLLKKEIESIVVGRVKRESCFSSVEMPGCDWAMDPFIFSRTEPNEIRVKYEPDPECTIYETIFDWSIRNVEDGMTTDFEDYPNKDTFIIEPYSILGGRYTISVAVKEIREDSEDPVGLSAPPFCRFEVPPEFPVPVIRGGPKITATSDEELVVSGEDSIDLDVPPGSPGNLEFKWSCEVIDQESEFCQQDLGNEPLITIPWTEAVDGWTYVVTLYVATPDIDWQSTQQVITFKIDQITDIEIKCVKNCLPLVPKTNNREAIVLEVICLRGCTSTKQHKYEWYIDEPDFDYDLDTKTGKNDNIFHINENALEEGVTYRVEVFLRGTSGEDFMEIEVHHFPELGPCSIIPDNGEALTTKFSINCQYEPGNYTFEIYSIQNDIEILVDSGQQLEDLSFFLSSGAKVRVKILDEYRFSDEEFLDVTVHSFLDATDPDEDIEAEILEKYFNAKSEFSLPKLMKSGNFQKALQVANSLADDMEKLKAAGKESLATKYFTAVLEEMDKVPLNIESRNRQVGSLAAKIIQSYGSKPEPDISALGTKKCKESSKNMLTSLKKKEYPNSYAEQTKEDVTMLTKCSFGVAGVNKEAVEPKTIAPAVTTPFPLLDVVENTENYPDYADDQESAKAMQKFFESLNDLIDLCYTASQQLALTMTIYDETQAVAISYFNITATLRNEYNLLQTKIKSHNIILTPPASFKQSNTIHIAVCTSGENLFWWLRAEAIYTSILMVQFNVKDKPVANLTKPFVVNFETKSNISALVKLHNYSTPKLLNKNVPKAEIDFEEISIHRIDAYSKQPFIIEFVDLPEDVTLDVAVTSFFKPTIEQFEEKVEQVDREKNRIFISNEKHYNSWYYLAVLPGLTMEDDYADYSFRVYTLSCYRWNMSEAKWIFACGSTRESSLREIICQCYQSHAFIGMAINNRVRAEETLIEELELEIQASYIIMVSVAVAFLLYCIFLTWYSIVAADEVLDETIYFLSDVPSSYRYAYVLIVRTGNKSRAGTTSNVTIKIYGTKSESDAHVLNYPDPEKKLLQKNEENWFFLATQYYLGDIEKIDLWCDFLGYTPAWFCSEIEIFDMQQNKYWLFQINKWFEVLKNEKMSHTAYSVQSNGIKKKKGIALRLLKKFFHSFRGAHMWNLLRVLYGPAKQQFFDEGQFCSREEQTITRMKRLHVVYSIFLTTYSIGLYLYGCPRLETNDSLVSTLDYRIDGKVVLITIACFLITFAVHFPVVWFFRYPTNIFRKKQKTANKHPTASDVLCWCFLIINITVSMTVLVVLGFWVPHITGLLWLTSVLTSLLIYIFILENVMRLIINFTINQQTRIQNIFKKIKSSLATVEKQRSLLYRVFGALLFRPLFQRLYEVPDEFKLKRQRYWAQIKERLWEIVEDLVMITIYVVLLYLVILMDRDVMTYFSHTEAGELIKGVHSRTALLTDVLNRKEMEDYIKDTLIISMQSLQWYGKYITNNPGMTMDNTNKYLGVARLRQHRTHNVSCTAEIVNQSVCYPTYFWNPEYRNFSEGWMADKLSNRFSRMDSSWNYRSSEEAGSESYIGIFSIYPGGGYIVTLGRTLQNSILNLNYLVRNKWIDSLSRCLFVEFLLYNPCNNLFNSVRIKFEIYPTGYIHHKLEIHTARLLFVKEEASTMLWIILISFIVMLTILVFKLTLRFIRKRKVLLKDMWYIGDIFIILMSIACLGLYVARSDVVGMFLSDLENAKNNEFVNYFHLMHAETTLTTVAAVLVFLATLRLWKLMRFMTIVKVVEKTLLLSAPPLLGLFLYQIVFTCACAFYAIVKYGYYSYDFRGLSETMTTLFLASLNINEEFEYENINSPLGRMFYSMYMLVMLGIFTLYIAFITVSYEEAQIFYSSEEDYNIVNLLKEQSQYYKELVRVKWRKLRLRGGTNVEESNRRVTPKSDEFRYANCVTLSSNKIDGMGFATKCILRNMKRGRKLGISDRDADLIKHTIVSLFRADTEEKEIFFTSNIHGEKLKLVDDRVMLRIEAVVETLLLRSEERSERIKRKELCKKIINSHEQKIQEIAENLNILSTVFNDVSINV